MSKHLQIAFLLLSLFGGGCGHALAHASLISTVPTDGAIVASSPSTLVLQFNETVAVTSVRLTSSDGFQHELSADVRNDQVAIPLTSALKAGSHVVSYRVVSADGHPVSGSIVFSIGAPTRTADEGSLAEPGVAIAIWFTRLAVYIGLLGSAGGAFFANWIAPHETPARTISGLRAAAVLSLFGLTLSVGLQGLDMLGEGFEALIEWRTWSSGFQSSLGLSVLVGAAACLSAFASLTSKSTNAERALSAMALLGSGLALSLTGHASSAPPQWLMKLAVFLHGVAAAYWIGSLMPLATIVHARGVSSLPTVRRFSAAAMIAVGTLVAAGMLMSIVQIGSWSALTQTNYGRLWIAKLAAVVVMLGLAGLNRLWLTPGLARSDTGGKHLVLSIGVELTVSLLVLGIVSGWRFTPPPRASAPVAVSAIHVHLHGLKAMADVELRPGRAGPMDVSATVLSGDFEPLVPQEVTFYFKNAGAGIEPIQKPATRTAEGNWVVKGLVLPVPGLWTVRAEVLISDFEKEIVEGDVGVP
ncbi:MAG: copper resistance protein CopC [Hyphomicrobiales bacterium]|nr:copper resistance protein CopC [Hyphomicrobiales bacterium]